MKDDSMTRRCSLLVCLCTGTAGLLGVHAGAIGDGSAQGPSRVSGAGAGAGPTADQTPNQDDWLDSLGAGADFSASEPPGLQAFAAQMRAILDPAMSMRGYSDAEIASLAETMSAVIRCQFIGTFDDYEGLMGKMGGKLRARTAPAETSDKAIGEARAAWQRPGAPNLPEQVRLSRAAVRAYDRTRAGAIIGTEKLPEGKAAFYRFSRFDWGFDPHEVAKGIADVVSVRLPVKDRNGLGTEVSFTYIKNPRSGRWVPYTICCVHPVRQPYPHINF